MSGPPRQIRPSGVRYPTPKWLEIKCLAGFINAILPDILPPNIGLFGYLL
jgi:hypothetical protein